MVFSQYVLSVPYSIVWLIKKLFNRLDKVVFYCATELDYTVFLPVQKYLKPIQVVTDSHSLYNTFKARGLKCRMLPVFPQAVIMCRHATHKFPCPAIIKIGMRHGAYHFKKMTKAMNYNQFDLYLMTSHADVQAATSIGVKCAKAVGFPKLDPFYQSPLHISEPHSQIESVNHNSHKPRLLFSSTWHQSGMSKVQLWCSRLGELTDKYEVMVTVHPWTPIEIINQITSTPAVKFIGESDILQYIKEADVCIGDTSSILAEFCALDKPIITFRSDRAKRTLDEIEELIASFTIQIDSFEELEPVIEQYIKNPALKNEERAKANRIMFDELDGKAGQRAAEAIIDLLTELGL